MGLGAIFKRLFARFFRAEETVPCSCCQAPIRRSDFDEGRAAVVARVRYCPQCVKDVIGRNAGGGVLHASSSSIHGSRIG